MKKTNFDLYLERQLKDPVFAERFERAGEAWDVALQIAALREKAGLSQKDLARKITQRPRNHSLIPFPSSYVLLANSSQEISPSRLQIAVSGSAKPEFFRIGILGTGDFIRHWPAVSSSH